MNISRQANTESIIENTVGFGGASRSELIQLMIGAMQRRILMPAEDFIALLEAIRQCSRAEGDCNTNV